MFQKKGRLTLIFILSNPVQCYLSLSIYRQKKFVTLNGFWRSREGARGGEVNPSIKEILNEVLKSCEKLYLLM